MSDPFVGEIRLFAGNFAPNGWAKCQGQILSISNFETLFNLIGTTYGGDGQQTFALPDLRGRVPVHQGQGPGLGIAVIGQQSGSETVTLTAAQMPAHSHVMRGSTAAATVTSPAGALLAATATNSYAAAANGNALAAQAVTMQGGSQPHENLAPTLTLTYIISLFGIFPSQN